MLASVATGSKKGYVDVKVPAKVRGKGIKAWKAWKKRWVVIHGMTNLTTNSPVVTIDMYSHESREGHQLERCTIYLERVKAICRTRSKSHSHAFSIEANESLLYLAGQSEKDSQQWISAFRLILCPQSGMPSLNTSIGQVFQATIIESLSSCSNKLCGTVGYIIALPSVILLAASNDGCILMEWPLTVIHRVSMVTDVHHPDDRDKILKIEISHVVTNAGIFHFYSENAITIVATLCRSIYKCKTSLPTYGTWTLDRPVTYIQTRKMSEDVAGFRKLKTISSSIKAASAEDILTSIFLCHSGDKIPFGNTKCETNLQNLNGEHKKMTVKEKISMSPKQMRASSCIDLFARCEKNKQAEENLVVSDRLKSYSDSKLSAKKKKIPDFYQFPQNPSVHGTKFNKYEKNSDKLKTNVEIIDDGESTIVDESGETQSEKYFHTQRPLSVYSSTSQVSRDSGVMMTIADEAAENNSQQSHIPYTPLMTKKATMDVDGSQCHIGDSDHISMHSQSNTNEGDGVAYRQFSEFMHEPEKMMLYNNQVERLSTSSDSTLYSEIDTYSDIKKDDPLYEDLDKFRKNIHKLLGIPESIGDPVKLVERTQKNSKMLETPPPLPPRRYKNKTLMSTPMIQVRRKDVMKYLGVDKDKFYGSLDKLQFAANDPPTIPSSDTKKRKDIYRYLGIPTMAASQPAGLNTTEQTYDSPIPRRYNDTLSNKNASLRKGTRTYVRMPSSQPRMSCTIVDNKPVKKCRMTFLKRKHSKDGSCEQKTASTYVSYDICNLDDWDAINNQCSAKTMIPLTTTHEEDKLNESLQKSTIMSSGVSNSLNIPFTCSESRFSNDHDIIEEEYNQHDNKSTMDEDYCIPRSLSVMQSSSCPFYVNLAELTLNGVHENANSAEGNIADIEMFNEVAKEGETDAKSIKSVSEQEENISCDAMKTKTSEDENDEQDSDSSADSNYLDMSRIPYMTTTKKKMKCKVSNVFTSNRNSEYMDMESPSYDTLPACKNETHSQNNCTEKSNSQMSNQVSTVDSLMCCIDELQKICKVHISGVTTDETSDDIGQIKIPGDYHDTETKACGSIVEPFNSLNAEYTSGIMFNNDPTCVLYQKEALSLLPTKCTDKQRSSCNLTESNTLCKMQKTSNSLFNTGEENTNLSKKLTSADIAELIDRKSLDEEQTSILHKNLSSYIDQLFEPSHSDCDILNESNDFVKDETMQSNDNTNSDCN